MRELDVYYFIIGHKPSQCQKNATIWADQKEDNKNICDQSKMTWIYHHNNMDFPGLQKA